MKIIEIYIVFHLVVQNVSSLISQMNLWQKAMTFFYALC